MIYQHRIYATYVIWICWYWYYNKSNQLQPSLQIFIFICFSFLFTATYYSLAGIVVTYYSWLVVDSTIYKCDRNRHMLGNKISSSTDWIDLVRSKLTDWIDLGWSRLTDSQWPARERWREKRQYIRSIQRTWYRTIGVVVPSQPYQRTVPWMFPYVLDFKHPLMHCLQA